MFFYSYLIIQSKYQMSNCFQVQLNPARVSYYSTIQYNSI